MRSRFTQSVETALNHALETAGSLGHNYIGSEHILLGLLSQKDSVAAQVLMDHGIDYDSALQAVKDTMGTGHPTRLNGSEMTARTAEIISLAAHEANKRGAEAVGTEHMLYAMLLKKDCVGAKIIAGAGINASAVGRSLVCLWYSMVR